MIELASFSRFNEIHLAFLDQLTESIGIVLNTIEATMRTEATAQAIPSADGRAAKPAAGATEDNRRLEPGTHAPDFRRTAPSSRKSCSGRTMSSEKAELADQNAKSSARIARSSRPSRRWRRKPSSSRLTSKYKSEFLANMSHELRTPLNSLLILARAARRERGRQPVAQAGRSLPRRSTPSGTDLLALINDILDLSKIESGKMAVEVEDVLLQRRSRLRVPHLPACGGRQRPATLNVEMEPELPKVMATDNKRLQQVLKNLISNALKFTEDGSVQLNIRRVESGWNPENEVLNEARNVIAF